MILVKKENNVRKLVYLAILVFIVSIGCFMFGSKPSKSFNGNVKVIYQIAMFKGDLIVSNHRLVGSTIIESGNGTITLFQCKIMIEGLKKTERGFSLKTLSIVAQPPMKFKSNNVVMTFSESISSPHTTETSVEWEVISSFTDPSTNERYFLKAKSEVLEDND